MDNAGACYAICISFQVKGFFKVKKRGREAGADGAGVSSAPAAPVSSGAGLRTWGPETWNRGAAEASSPLSASRIATVYRAVAVLSDSVGRLPLEYKVFSNAEGRFVPFLHTAEGRRLNGLLTVAPNGRMSAFEFFKNLVKLMLLEGNAYVLPRLGMTGDVEEFVLLAPGSVSYDKYADTYTVMDVLNGVNGTFTGAEMIHVRNESLDGGYTGLSTLTYARETLSTAATGGREMLDRFATGGRLKALLSNDTSARGWGQYQDDQMEAAQDLIQEQISAGRDIIRTPGDAKVFPLSMNAADMQFVDQMKLTDRDISRFFNVPPVLLMDDAGSNYKSGDMAMALFLSNGLSPLLAKIEQEFRRKLVPRSLWGRYKFSFDTEGLFITDLATRGQWMKMQVETGTGTPDELRRKLDLPPVEGGDRETVSANLKPLDGAVDGPSVLPAGGGSAESAGDGSDSGGE